MHLCEPFLSGAPYAYFGAPCTPVEERCSNESGPMHKGEWRLLSHGCRKVPMDQYANCFTIVNKVCNLTVTNHDGEASVMSFNTMPRWTSSQF